MHGEKEKLPRCGCINVGGHILHDRTLPVFNFFS